MIDLAATNPSVDVAPAEYFRLLGYPRGRMLEGRAAELAAWAREWYAANGRPWICVRPAEAFEAAGGVISIEGEPFTSARLQQMIERAGAHGAMLAAVSAGPEAEDAAQQLWREEKPDEYFFLQMFASAVVEHLVTVTGARLCAWAEERGMAVLPHYSPGYPEWDIAEQPRLLAVVKRCPLPGWLEALDSGALRPNKSLLAVFGVTRHTERVQRLTDLQPCENCSFTPCAYRRAPFRGDRPARYSVNLKALRRWAAERLRLEPRPGGHTLATFRYDGTTCCNMGRPLAFDYTVLLGPEEHGYPICEQSCAPAPGDTGHTAMCEYITNAERLMSAIGREKPLCGKPLDEILSWTRPTSASGCYCDAAARDHKWGLVLETIHFKLNGNA
jgi:hypothetical protein